MKLICNEQHWKIQNGQLLLDTPDGQEAIKAMIKVLEKEIRNSVYEEICAIDLTTDRKRVMKNGIENALLTVQDLCAKVALGESNATD